MRAHVCVSERTHVRVGMCVCLSVYKREREIMTKLEKIPISEEETLCISLLPNNDREFVFILSFVLKIFKFI